MEKPKVPLSQVFLPFFKKKYLIFSSPGRCLFGGSQVDTPLFVCGREENKGGQGDDVVGNGGVRVACGG